MPKSRRVRAFVLVALALVAAGGAVALAEWYVNSRPLTLTAERIEFRIPAGASVRAIAQTASQAGIALNENAFVLLARATDSAGKLRVGRYAVERGITLRGLLAKLKAGDVLLERLTVPEGVSFAEMRGVLAAATDLRQDSVKMSASELLRAVGSTESHPEGLFAPETYLYDPGASDLDIWRQAYRMQSKALESAWATRAPDLPYKSPYEALIMASIIEKETGQAAERAEVAGVFVNRLRLGMLLQTDPTVIYGLGASFDGNLRKRDLLRDGPYNSYTRVGLPPTPIALPGKASIEAALRPAATRALYFVARGDGTSYFSETIAEHNRAVDKYQRGIGK
jgi:UPF0755 protein